MPKRTTSQRFKRPKLDGKAPATEAREQLPADTKTTPAAKPAPAKMRQGAQKIEVALDAARSATQASGESTAVQGGGATSFEEEDLFDYDDIEIFPTETEAGDDLNEGNQLGADAGGKEVKEVKPTTEVKLEQDEFDIELDDDTLEEASAAVQARAKVEASRKKAHEKQEADKKKDLEQEEADKKKAAAAALHGGKKCLVQGIQGNFLYVPTLQTSLGLNNINDTVTTKFAVNGTSLEVSLKVVSVDNNSSSTTTEKHAEKPAVEIKQEAVNPPPSTTLPPPPLQINTIKAQTALRNAPPLSAGPSPTPTATTHYKPPCKFGLNCNKGSACPFNHSNTAGTPKQKLCTWVNTPQGCTKGSTCAFSHALEDIKCIKSKYRSTCLNSFKCAYKHDDDVDYQQNQQNAAMQMNAPKTFDLAQQAALVRASREASVSSRFDDSKPASPMTTALANVPSGPKNAGTPAVGVVAGQKRGREDGDDAEGRNIQRVRSNDQIPESQHLQQPEYNSYRAFAQVGGYPFQYQQGRGRGWGRARGRGGRGRGGVGGGGLNNNETGRECYGELSASNNGGGGGSGGVEIKMKGVAATSKNE